MSRSCYGIRLTGGSYLAQGGFAGAVKPPSRSTGCTVVPTISKMTAAETDSVCVSGEGRWMVFFRVGM